MSEPDGHEGDAGGQPTSVNGDVRQVLTLDPDGYGVADPHSLSVNY